MKEGEINHRKLIENISLNSLAGGCISATGGDFKMGKLQDTEVRREQLQIFWLSDGLDVNKGAMEVHYTR